MYMYIYIYIYIYIYVRIHIIIYINIMFYHLIWGCRVYNPILGRIWLTVARGCANKRRCPIRKAETRPVLRS